MIRHSFLRVFIIPLVDISEISTFRGRFCENIFLSLISRLMERAMGTCGTGKHRVHFGAGKSKVRTNRVSTGTPFTVVGLKTHLRAASTAASRKSGWPLMAIASVTRPASEMVTRTSTDPDALNLLALCG
jgi:hypothetical protein